MVERTLTKLEREGALEIGGLEMRDRCRTRARSLPKISRMSTEPSGKLDHGKDWSGIELSLIHI